MVKIGIIGSGFGLYGLLPAFNSLKNCNVTSICGKKTERLLRDCEEIGLKNIYTDWNEMIKREKLDAIAIAVTPSVQYEIAKECIQKGIHLFLEKPLAANLDQANELITLAKSHKVITAVDFIFPEIDEWKKVKEILDCKTFGKLQHIAISWDFLSYDIKNHISSWKTNISQGGGALAFYFSHVLYYLEYFGGKIIDIKSVLSESSESSNGGEVGVDILVKFANNINAYAHLYSNSKGLHRHQLIFHCSEGTIVLENKNSILQNFKIKMLTEKKVQNVSLVHKLSARSEDQRVKVVKKIASRFIQSCLTKQQMIPSITEGVRVQKLIEKIRSSSI